MSTQDERFNAMQAAQTTAFEAVKILRDKRGEAASALWELKDTYGWSQGLLSSTFDLSTGELKSLLTLAEPPTNDNDSNNRSTEQPSAVAAGSSSSDM